MIHSIKRELIIAFLLLSTIFLYAYPAFAQIDTQAEIDSLTHVYEESEDLGEGRMILKALSVSYQDKGIYSSRLKSAGWGESKLLDDNETAEGKANNRRVEFVKF